MIYGFDILTGINEETAAEILNVIRKKMGKRQYDMPANNPIRSIMVNNSFRQYFLWITVNAGILVIGKETFDIEFTEEPDFSVLDEKFRIYTAEILGNDIAEQLPCLCDWGLHIIRYGMDIEVENISRLMRIFVKTEIPKSHLNPNLAVTMIEPYDYPEYGGKLEIYPKAELIRADRIDCVNKDIKNAAIDDNRDVLRLLLVHKRGNMGNARRLMKKFEMDTWRLESYLNPLIVTNVFMRAYLDTIGGGDFYTYDRALEIIENEVPNRENRRALIEFITNKGKLKKDLKLLRALGINGVMLDFESDFTHLVNPVEKINEKCRIYPTA